MKSLGNLMTKWLKRLVFKKKLKHRYILIHTNSDFCDINIKFFRNLTEANKRMVADFEYVTKVYNPLYNKDLTYISDFHAAFYCSDTIKFSWKIFKIK